MEKKEKYGLTKNYLFRRTKPTTGRWHIRDERLANGPASLPFCARSGVYCHSTKEVESPKRICPDCLEIVRENSSEIIIKL